MKRLIVLALTVFLSCGCSRPEVIPLAPPPPPLTGAAQLLRCESDDVWIFIQRDVATAFARACARGDDELAYRAALDRLLMYRVSGKRSAWLLPVPERFECPTDAGRHEFRITAAELGDDP